MQVKTDCLYGLIVFVASEGLVLHSASTFKHFIHPFFNTAQLLRLQKQFYILKRRHVLPRGISHHFSYSKAKAFHDFPQTITSELLIFISHTPPPQISCYKVLSVVLSPTNAQVHSATSNYDTQSSFPEVHLLVVGKNIENNKFSEGSCNFLVVKLPTHT